MRSRVIEVWVCPTPGCSNYYGVPGGPPDLATNWNRDLKGKKTFTRDHCPICKTVKRIRKFAVILDIGPDDVQVYNEGELVQKAYRLLREAGHESVR